MASLILPNESSKRFFVDCIISFKSSWGLDFSLHLYQILLITTTLFLSNGKASGAQGNTVSVNFFRNGFFSFFSNNIHCEKEKVRVTRFAEIERSYT